MMPKKIFLSGFLLFFFSPFFPSNNLRAEIQGTYKLAEGKTEPKANSYDTVKVVEVFSITCPHCYEFFKKEDPLLKKFDKKLNLSWIEVGWIGPNLTQFFYLADKQKKGFLALDVLFRAFHEAGIADLNNPEQLKIFASDLKMGANFLKEMQTPDIIKRYTDGVATTSRFGIKSTPAFIVEDSLILSGNDSANLAKVVNSLLKKPVVFP